jgi:hypothetical protein
VDARPDVFSVGLVLYETYDGHSRPRIRRRRIG